MKGILLLSGYSGSGKSYVADILKTRCTRCYSQFAFADYLKDIVSEKYNITRNDLDTQEGKRKLYANGKTYRQILIDESAELKRFNEDIFIDFVINKIKNSKCRIIVISDWRFPHEFYKIQEAFVFYSVVSIRIHRNFYNAIDDKSESSLEKFNFHYNLYNNENLMSQLNEYPYV